MSQHMENPPGVRRGARESEPAVGTERELHRQSTEQAADPLARAPRYAHALRVVWERADGRACTNFYSTLPAAERKMQRTRERGLAARIELVRLVPSTMTADVLADLDAEGGSA